MNNFLQVNDKDDKGHADDERNGKKEIQLSVMRGKENTATMSSEIQPYNEIGKKGVADIKKEGKGQTDE